uniref:Ribosomal RNA-processing protein 14/surfeit locus protein 6 C-terminal domain-containing protein n=1 Tax=Cyprinus carpio TaxID=7962 RepID=A0A8C1S192_CYPCA
FVIDMLVYSFIQSLNRQSRLILVPFRGSGVNDGSPSNKKKPTKRDNVSANRNKLVPKTQPAKTVQNGISEIQKKPEGKNVTDILRQRFIRRLRSLGPPKDPSSEEVKKKRERRKQEKESECWLRLLIMQAQRKKKWAQRNQQVMEKMQKRQDKRRRNIKKCKDAKMEKRKQRARKKCCVLPEDLKKASL